MLKRAYYGYACAWAWATQPSNGVGRQIYAHDWDVLVVLDSMRVDLLNTVERKHDLLPWDATFGSCWSRGSITTEWLARTFTPQQRAAIADTAFLAATPHTSTVWDDGSLLTNEPAQRLPFPAADVVPRDGFATFDEVWRYAHDPVQGVVPPDAIVDRAITHHRRHRPERMVVHVIQPHEPFLAPTLSPHVRGESVLADDIWTGLAAGTLPAEQVWRAYRANHAIALQAVARLLENLDADRVVITSDHGNLFGELGQYGHPFGMLHPAVRRVPWVETSGVDEETSAPAATPETDVDVDVDVADRLEQLGYR